MWENSLAFIKLFEFSTLPHVYHINKQPILPFFRTEANFPSRGDLNPKSKPRHVCEHYTVQATLSINTIPNEMHNRNMGS